MLTSRAIGVPLLLILCCSLGATMASADPSPTTTLIDILSSQSEYSLFLRHIQRAGLVPLINSLRCVTLLAPINLAFAGADWSKDTPQLLLRYIISLPLRVPLLGHSEAVFSTHWQIKPQLNYTIVISPDEKSQQYIVDNTASVALPDLSAKHQASFVQPIEQLLPLKPTLCEWIVQGEEDAQEYEAGPHNISWTRQLFHLLFFDPSAKHASCTSLLNSAQTLFFPTDAYVADSMSPLVIDYYTSLYRYVTSTPSTYDTTEKALAEFRADVRSLAQSLGERFMVLGLNGTTGAGSRYALDPQTHSLVINNKVYSNRSIVLADGIIHIFDAQPEPSFFNTINAPLIEMIPRKALNTLHYSNFVRELYFRNLQHLIDGSTANQTVFVETIERDDNIDEDEMIDSFSNRQSLMYHFSSRALPDFGVTPSHHPINVLVPSRLCSNHRIGGCFPLKLSQSWRDNHLSTTLNDEVEIKSPPIYIGNNSYLFFIDQELTPPLSFKNALGNLISNGGVPRHVENIQIDSKSCLVTIGLLKKFNLLSFENNDRGYTAFLPCGVNPHSPYNSWEQLGLLFAYLQNNPKVFKSVLQLLIFKDLIYSDYTPTAPRVIQNLNSDLVNFTHVETCEEENHISINNIDITLPLNSDVLFSQGSLHVVDRVLLFDTFHISFLELLNTTADPHHMSSSLSTIVQTMPQLRQLFGLDNQTSGADSSPSILVPATRSLMDQNITSAFAQLPDFFKFHTLSNSEAAKLVLCISGTNFDKTADIVIRTNLGNASLRCTYDSHNGHSWLRLVQPVTSLKLKNYATELYNKDHEIRLLSHGCVRSVRYNVGPPQCVFLVDKPLNLQWLSGRRDGDFLHIHIGFLSVGVGIIIGALITVIMLASLVCFTLRKARSRKLLSPQRVTVFAPTQTTPFMSVQSDEENTIDYGYETDTEYARNEFSPLSQVMRASQKKHTTYGSTSSLSRSFQDTSPKASTPRSIRGSSLARAFDRERNLPGL